MQTLVADSVQAALKVIRLEKAFCVGLAGHVEALDVKHHHDHKDAVFDAADVSPHAATSVPDHPRGRSARRRRDGLRCEDSCELFLEPLEAAKVEKNARGDCKPYLPGHELEDGAKDATN